MTIATFKDAYFGKVMVTLEKHGKGWLWCAEDCINTGYRPVASERRAINNARHDHRFSDIEAE